jgi:hypothetical protein
MKKVLSITTIIVFLVSPAIASSYAVEHFQGVPVEGRFIVGPAKIEREILPGNSLDINISVENRTGSTQIYTIGFEDFVSGENSPETVKLLGENRSNTTLSDYFFVSEAELTLEHGDRAQIPVRITLPANITPGGRFGSVIVSATEKRAEIVQGDRAQTGATVVGRIATLVFVTVPGDVTKSGKLIGFETKNKKKLFFSSQIPLRISVENTGNVHLNAYGGIVLTNMIGQTVETVVLDPWFVLPGSIRTRDVTIDGNGFFGRYEAKIEVNRGYDDLVDSRELTFIVLSPRGLVLILIALFVVFLLVNKRRFGRSKKTI